MLHSYSSPYNIGHKALEDFFDGKIVVQEKIDGSQISFGNHNGELFVRSRRTPIDLDDPGMFARGIDTIKSIDDILYNGYTYRGEYLAKPKHNTLSYNRVPVGHIIIYDIDRGDQDYMDPEEIENETQRINLEAVPFIGEVFQKPSVEWLDELLTKESVLGGVKIEGVVLKNYSKFGPDKKVLMAKYVSDAFKEKHGKDWKERNPGQNDFVNELALQYKTDARWMKTVQHLRESGELENNPRDIPKLMREVNQDILQECEEEIKDALFKHFWKKTISRSVTHGLPEWYKGLLVSESLPHGEKGNK